MKKKMIIIGGGISGIYLSILLKKYLDMDVVVLEANDKPLKKLLATGNGRCNLSNKDLDKALDRTCKSTTMYSTYAFIT